MARKSENLLPLNAQAVKAARAINKRKTEYRIKEARGLVLIVLPSGTGTYYYRYEVREGQRRKFHTLKLGRRDALTIHAARSKCEDHRRTVENGGDPVSDRKARAKAITLRQLAEERFRLDTKLKESTKTLHRYLFNKHVFPTVGHIPADDVTPDTVSALLDKIEAGSARQADKVRSVLSSLFSWGRGRRLTKANPTRDLAKRGTSRPRKRVLSDDELAGLWRITGSTETNLTPAMRKIIRLALLTGQRRTEVAGARVSELALDGSSPTWTIPGDEPVGGEIVYGRTKNGEKHTVPLSRQAAELWREAIKEAGDSEYAFPADASHTKIGGQTRLPHIHGESVSRAMRRIREQLGIKDITVHDLRRTMATAVGETGVGSDLVAKLLNHKPRDITGSTYNHAKLLAQGRRALQDWADYVIKNANGEKSEQTNVVSLTPTLAGLAMARS